MVDVITIIDKLHKFVFDNRSRHARMQGLHWRLHTREMIPISLWLNIVNFAALMYI